MASVTYGTCIMANVIMAKVFMAKVLWQMKHKPLYIVFKSNCAYLQIRKTCTCSLYCDYLNNDDIYLGIIVNTKHVT